MSYPRRFRKTVKYGHIDSEKDLPLLQDDFAYELFKDEKLKRDGLQVIEKHRPQLSHAVEAAFVHKNNITVLSDGADSCRIFFKKEQEIEREKFNCASRNLKCNYNESKSDAAVKRVTTVARNSEIGARSCRARKVGREIPSSCRKAIVRKTRNWCRLRRAVPMCQSAYDSGQQRRRVRGGGYPAVSDGV